MKPNPYIQILGVLLMGLIVSALLLEPWNRLVDQADTRLRRSFFGLEKSYSIEREATKIIREAYSYVNFDENSSDDPFARLPDYLRIMEWLSDMEDRVIYRLHRTLCRTGSILAIFPVAFLMLTAALMDGMMGRRMKQLRFDYPSPLLHRASILLFSGLNAIFILLILSPLPYAPQENILFMFLTGQTLKLHLLHLPKRI
jgi:hypothetical protein